MYYIQITHNTGKISYHPINKIIDETDLDGLGRVCVKWDKGYTIHCMKNIKYISKKEFVVAVIMDS